MHKIPQRETFLLKFELESEEDLTLYIRHALLTNDEKTTLDEIMRLIHDRSGGDLQDSIREVFENSLWRFTYKTEFHDDIFNKNKSRILGVKVSNRDQRVIAIIYDFIVSDFRRDLNHSLKNLLSNSAEPHSETIIAEIRSKMNSLIALKKKRDERSNNILLNTLSWTDLDDQIAGIPNSLVGSYIGYRRSAMTGDIIRFYIEINNPRNENVFEFTNKYSRHEEDWDVKGFGYKIGNTIYLIGHCMNQNEITKGLRLMALKSHSDNNLLFGPLLSMRKGEPIAARILLIPFSDHTFSSERIRKYEKGEIEWITNRPESQSFKDFCEEIDQSLKSFFRNRPLDFYRYICNNNFSTLWGDPEYESELIDAEVAFRQAMYKKHDGDLHAVRKEYIERVTKALRDDN